MENNESKQTIDCDVHSCIHCNCSCDKCELKEIKICNCSFNEEKEATMCDSYEKNED